jgi:hypothetical protein
MSLAAKTEAWRQLAALATADTPLS